MKTKQEKKKAIERAIEDGFPDWLYQFKSMADAARHRAEAGSTGDADFLRIMAISMLQTRGPAPLLDRFVVLPDWMADYLANALQGDDISKTLMLKKKKGRNQFTNEKRNWDIYEIADNFKDSQPERYLEATADYLDQSGVPPPIKGSVWTAGAVADAVKAHEVWIKSGYLFPRSPEDS